MAANTSAYFGYSSGDFYPLNIVLRGDAGTGATHWTVKWGDGAQDDVNPQGDGTLFAFHSYPSVAGSAEYQIRVTGHTSGAQFTTVKLHVFDNFNTTGPNVETGGNGQDFVSGGSGVDNFAAKGGDDWFFGNGGDDIANAGYGNDQLSGGANDDTLNGQQGDDTVYGGQGDDSITGGDGNDFLGDVLNGEDPETGDDIIDGGDGDDTIMGVKGNDMLTGGRGDDNIDAGAGNDTINGGDGIDIILAGEGVDTMNGGAGADIFEFRNGDGPFDGGYDTVESFERTEDILAFDVGSGTYDSFEDLHIKYRHNTATIRYSDDGDKVKVMLSHGEVLDHFDVEFYNLPG